MNRYLALAIALTSLPLVAAAAEPLLLWVGNSKDAARRAEAALKTTIGTVVDKAGASPAGDARDYVSYSRYWWPDPAKPDGLPFVRHDGKHNVEYVAKGDLNRFERLADTVEALAQGWVATGDERFAERIAGWIRAWMITPETRMNPSLEYSQVRLGHDGNRGNKAGVLDGRRLLRVIDAFRVTANSGALTEDERIEVQEWFAAFYKWLTTSRLGKQESNSANNHGTWYFVQALGFARQLGLEKEARDHCATAKFLIKTQIKPDGSQPLELARADGLGYCVFNLEAHLTLALLAQPLGVDLLEWVPESGGGLRKALALVSPYNDDPTEWPHSWDPKIKKGFLDEALAMVSRLESAN